MWVLQLAAKVFEIPFARREVEDLSCVVIEAVDSVGARCGFAKGAHTPIPVCVLVGLRDLTTGGWWPGQLGGRAALIGEVVHWLPRGARGNAGRS